MNNSSFKAWLSSVFITIMLAYSIALLAQQGISINAGMAGSWANPDVPGQGIFTDVDPENRTVFLAWFTYGDAPADPQSVIGAATNRWFVAVGEYEAGSSNVELSLSETSGGIFDNPAPVSENVVGSISLKFLSCGEAELGFTFDDGGEQGQIHLTRLTSTEVCETIVVN